ncbi:TPA: ABC transporter substrate-binding protein, partial [Mannheimia haemolytica]|nr:ABC transporter substrate-binding protein [Mannheimia haemolytica]
IQFKSIFFDIINNYINNNLSDILSPVRGYFLDNEIIYDFRAKKINKINFKKLKIAYLDYYPNKNIICVLSEYLLSMGFEVELYGFDIKSYCNLDKSIYDIYLTLSVMLTESKYDLSIYYISYLLDKDIDGFLDIINSDNSNEDYKKQSEYLLSHALCLPICRGKFIYLKSKYADNFHVNDKGLFNL